MSQGNSPAKSPGSEEPRRTSRRTLAAGESIACRISHASGHYTGHILDLSSWGLGVGLGTLAQLPFQLGDAVTVAFSPSQETDEITLSAIVANTWQTDVPSDVATRIGLSLVAHEDESLGPDDDRRLAGRYAIPELICPQAWANHPWFAQDRIYFQVCDVSPYGFTLATTAPQCALIPSMHMTLAVAFPGGPTYVLPVEVSRVTQAERTDWYHVGVKFQKRSRDFLGTVAEYLLSITKNLSIAELRQVGFPVGTLEKSLIFKHINTFIDFKEVISIRQEATGGKGTQACGEFDEFSRIHLVRIGDKAVATGKLIFNGGHRERSAIQRHVPIPKELWDAGFAEPTQLDVLPAYRALDNLHSFALRNLVRVAYEQGLPYLVTCADPQTLQHCLEVGGKPLHLSFQQAGTDFEMVAFDVNALMQGERISPLQFSYEQPETRRREAPASRRPTKRTGKGLAGADDALLLFQKMNSPKKRKKP